MPRAEAIFLQKLSVPAIAGFIFSIDRPIIVHSVLFLLEAVETQKYIID
jgi:hypothetical protein